MTRDDGYTRYTVRIPTPLYERLKAAAGEKSVNAEIVERLQKILDEDDAAKALRDSITNSLSPQQLSEIDRAIEAAISKTKEELEKSSTKPFHPRPPRELVAKIQLSNSIRLKRTKSKTTIKSKN